jgi:hypothetical protein
MRKDRWGKRGNLQVKIPPDTTSIYSMGIHGGENGKPFKVSVDVDTKNGKVAGDNFISVGDSLSKEKFIGGFHVIRQ